MFKSLKKVILLFIIGVFLLTPFFSALAATIDTGLSDTAETAGLAGLFGTDQGPAEIIGKVIGAILAFVGVIFLVLMIYGGIVWMLARGNDQEVVKAKNIINSAIFGIVIVVASYAITRTVLYVLQVTSN